MSNLAMRTLCGLFIPIVLGTIGCSISGPARQAGTEAGKSAGSAFFEETKARVSDWLAASGPAWKDAAVASAKAEAATIANGAVDKAQNYVDAQVAAAEAKHAAGQPLDTAERLWYLLGFSGLGGMIGGLGHTAVNRLTGNGAAKPADAPTPAAPPPAGGSPVSPK